MPLNFLGLPSEYSRFDTSKVVILPIPYEKTTTYIKGTSKGPEAILKASYQVELYDEELQVEPFHIGIYTSEPLCNDQPEPEEMVERVRKEVVKLVRQGKYVIGLGGEHSISIGIARAFADVFGTFTTVQIDAHTDLREEYEGSKYNHACIMKRILEVSPGVHIGIRSMCLEEAELVKERNIPVISAREIYSNSHWMDKALSHIKTDRVFLTIDADGFDPSVIPGVGTPEPGGLLWYPALVFLRKLFKAKDVIGFDITELCPLENHILSDFTCAKLVYKLIGYKYSASNT
jgi:agmatinase